MSRCVQQLGQNETVGRSKKGGNGGESVNLMTLHSIHSNRLCLHVFTFFFLFSVNEKLFVGTPHIYYTEIYILVSI